MKLPPHRSKIKILLTTLAGAALGAGIGWLLRGDVSSAVNAPAEPPSVSVAPERSTISESKPNQPAAAEDKPKEETLFPLLRLLCAADTAAPRDMPRLLLAARATPGVVPFLAQHWAEFDAPHMFGVLRGETGARPLSRDAAVRQALFDTWLVKDKAAALTALDDDNALPDMSSLRSPVIRDLLHKEPERALQKLTQWRLNLHYNDMNGIAEWAKRDPAAAANASAQVPMRMVSEHLIIEIAKVWGRTDPAAAMQWCLQHPGRAAVASMAHNVRMVWEDHDAAACAAFAASVNDPAMRMKLGLPPQPRGRSQAEVIRPTP